MRGAPRGRAVSGRARQRWPGLGAACGRVGGETGRQRGARAYCMDARNARSASSCVPGCTPASAPARSCSRIPLWNRPRPNMSARSTRGSRQNTSSAGRGDRQNKDKIKRERQRRRAQTRSGELACAPIGPGFVSRKQRQRESPARVSQSRGRGGGGDIWRAHLFAAGEHDLLVGAPEDPPAARVRRVAHEQVLRREGGAAGDGRVRDGRRVARACLWAHAWGGGQRSREGSGRVDV